MEVLIITDFCFSANAYPFKCEIADEPEDVLGTLADALLELRSNNEAFIDFENKTDL